MKRIKPAAFTPYDLARENYTRQLWAFEGITSYYDDLALVRSGVIEPASYLELLGRTITTVLRTPGRHRQSVAESSFDAWIKFYRRTRTRPMRSSAITRRARWSRSRSISRCAAPARRSTRSCARCGNVRPNGRRRSGGRDRRHRRRARGRDLGDFFARYVDGTDDPPLAALLADFGVTLNVRAAAGGDDRGGKPGKRRSPAESSPRLWLGAKLSGGAEPQLQHVYAGGPAERAGLAGGDTFIAIDGLRASVDSIGKLLARHRAGETVSVHAFRRDELVVTDLTLGLRHSTRAGSRSQRRSTTRRAHDATRGWA